MIKGIDVSVHQGAIDWKKVKQSGQEFVFIRVGWAGWDGPIVKNGGLDKNFHTNMKGAIAAGLKVGVYVYSYCKTAAAAVIAAKETLELVKSYNLEYPIAFDIEDTSNTGTPYNQMSKALNTSICKAFLDEIEKGGYYGMLYTYKSFINAYLDGADLRKYDFWLAEYTTATKPTYTGTYGIWQYSGTGSCPGIVGQVDLNIAYKDYATLIKNAGLNGQKKPDTSTPPVTGMTLEQALARINELEGILKAIKEIVQ